jgi:hypothetical protein
MKSFPRQIIKITLLIAVILYCIIQGLKGGDFKIYLGAAELLSQGKSCFGEWIHLSGDNYGQYSYSPFFATLLIPFTLLPSGITEVIWLLANLFFLKRILEIISSMLNLSLFSKKEHYLWLAISTLLVLRFVLHNFEMVQMNIFLLFCCLESFHQAKKKNYWLSGLLLALGITIKILPLVLIPYFLYRKILKPLPFTFLFTLTFLLFPALFFGWEFNLSLHSQWWDIINPSNTVYMSDQNKFGEGVHSLSGLFAAYFSDTPSLLETSYSRTIRVLEPETITLLINIARTFLITLTLFFLRTLPFKESGSNYKSLWELSYILCIVPLIFPHQQKYSFVFMAPAVFYLIYYLIMVKSSKQLSNKGFGFRFALMTIFFILTTLTTDGIVGDYINDLSEYYKAITFGSLFLIVALSICRPSKSIENPSISS